MPTLRPPMQRPLAVLRALVWPVLIAVLIVSASARPRLASPGITNIDKVTHFAVYGLLATLLCRAGRGWRGAMLGFVAAAAFGATDEWHQSFVPGRSPELADWIADALGAAVAVSLYWGWTPYRRFLEWPIRLPRRVTPPVAAAPAVSNENAG